MNVIKRAALSLLIGCYVAPVLVNADEDALSVTVVTLGNVAFKLERDVKAELVSLNNTPVSSELSARVQVINANVGDLVKKGEVLARLDCRDFDVAVRKAKAGVYSVKARIAASEARAGASKSRVDAAESRVKAADARVSAARSQIKASQSRYSAAESRINARIASKQSTGTRIKTAESRVKTAEAQASSASARIPAAQAQYRFAQAELTRNRQLHAERLIPTSTLDQARSTFDSAQSSLSSARADAEAAKGGISTARAEISAAQADYRASQAEVEASEADLATSKADIDTQTSNTDISRADVETAKTDVATSRSEWKAAKADTIATKTELESALAQLESAEVVAERCKITAPFDGQITRRDIQLGQVAMPGAQAFQILQIGDLEVSTRLSSSDISDQKQGENTRFVADDIEVEAKRRAVVALVDNTTGTQEVRFILKQAHSFPVGKVGRLRWQGKRQAVAADWIMRRDGKLGLMLAKKDRAEFYPLQNAKEGQPAFVDLPSETLLINDNRLRARHGQPIKQVKP